MDASCWCAFPQALKINFGVLYTYSRERNVKGMPENGLGLFLSESRTDLKLPETLDYLSY